MAGSLSSVARGVGAVGSANQRAGRASSPSYGDMSPLVQSYNQWSFGRPYNTGLPHDPKQFNSGAFGPLDPIVPVGIDTPPDGSERPMPRRWEYQVGWNMPVGQPGTEGLKIATFATLRSFADLYSVIRACITHITNEILSTDWDIVPTAQAEKAMHGNQKKQDDFAHRRQEAMKFWSRPDPQYRDWAGWMRAVVEDHAVLDAVALYVHPTRARGHGPFNSNMASLDVLDGSTIRPLLDMRGSTPQGQSVAYQQYVWGVPRVDMMTPLMGDEDAIQSQWVKDYRGDQLLYLPYYARTWTPYGFSNVERALIPAATGLRRQIYAMQYYTEGTIPAVYVTPGTDIATPTQIADLQRALNNIAGDQAWKHRVIVLPPGSKTEPQKTISLADQFDQILAAEVTMAFEMTPMDIGITPRVSAVQSPSESKEFSQINQQKAQKSGLIPRLNFFKAVFDFIIQRSWGQDDMEWKWTGIETGDDLQVKVDVWTALVKSGIASIDQAAAEFGIDPWGLPETTQPILITNTGPIKLSGGLEPDEQVKEPDSPTDVEVARVTGHGSTGTQHNDSDATSATPTKKPQTTATGKAGTKPATTTTGKPAPKPASSGGTPAVVTPAHHAARHAEGKPKPTHAEAAKMAEAELEALVRHIRKGREVGDWLPKALSPLVMGAFRSESDVDQALVKARGILNALAEIAKRTSILKPIVDWIARTLAKLALRLRRGEISTVLFVHEAANTMRHGYELATRSASEHAAESMPDTPTVDFEGLAGDLAEEQHGYLQRLMPVVLSADDEFEVITGELLDRLHSYTDSLTGAYNTAYGETIERAHPDVEIIWHLGDTEHCALCIARDGVSYTRETLPGYPGDGGFGGPLCEGGPKCGCWLEYRKNGETTAVAGNLGRQEAGDNAAAQNVRARDRRQAALDARDAFIETLPDTEPAPGQPSAQLRARTIEALRRDLAGMLNERIRESGGYQGVSVEPQDIPATIIAQLLPPEMQGPYKPPNISLEEAVRQMFTGKVAALDLTRDDFTGMAFDVVLDELTKSPKTPMYSATHHPLGVEGLWHHEGLQLPAYIQNVAKGLMESGHPRSEAIPMAINAIKRWARGEGHVHPEVRAASRKALAEWSALKAEHNKSKG